MSLQELKARLLADPEVKEAYDALEAEDKIIRNLIEARLKQNITQAKLAELTGLKQSNISRLERGTANPTVSTLKKLAKAFNKKLVIDFVDR
ncbi:MAG: helix-turn-helix transcriptional regulator [Spirochaetaceae bacterium]|nr:helix-turn-helix transcriptional regulator [Spirochaetaceae bacterium]